MYPQDSRDKWKKKVNTVMNYFRGSPVPKLGKKAFNGLNNDRIDRSMAVDFLIL